MRRLRVFLVLPAMALLRGAPAQAGPPFRTDDPVPVDQGHFEINLFSYGTDGSAGAAPVVSSIDTETDAGWTGYLPGMEVNYGLAPNLQVHITVQQGFTAPPGGRTGLAFGDVELGTKYRFLNPGDDDWYPQAAVYPTIELPVGNRKLGFNTGRDQIYLPLWLQKDRGPWTLYGGGGYWINPGPGNRNWVFAGVALWRAVTARLNMGVELFHQSSASVAVPDSTGLDVGLAYDFSKTWHLLLSAGTGLQNREQTNVFSYYSALQLTF